MAANSNHSAVDIQVQRLSAVYAKAFLGAAHTAGDVGAWVAELRQLQTDVLDKYPEFAQLLGSAFVSRDDKIGILDRTLSDRLSPGIVAFLKVLAEHDRLDCLEPIVREVKTQYDALQGRIGVTIRSPGPIDGPLRAELTSALATLLGAEPELTLQSDPGLIGGMVIQVGDTVYDGSVASRLRQMRTQMVDRTVEQIETNRDRFLNAAATNQ